MLFLYLPLLIFVNFCYSRFIVYLKLFAIIWGIASLFISIIHFLYIIYFFDCFLIITYHHFSHSSSSLYFDYSWIHGLWSVRFFLKGNVQKAKETQRLSSPKHKVVGLDLIPDSPVQPHLDRWTRSRKAIAMYLSCGILQVSIVILLCIFFYFFI